MKFGERLKMLRAKKGITQEDLASALDIPSSTIRRLETDNVALPRRERLEAIADYFNVKVDYLLGRDEPVVQQPSETEFIIREIVEEFNLDLTIPGQRERLTDLIKIVLTDHERKQ